MITGLHHPAAEGALLVLVVLCCWVGVAGMIRMREPTQALQYLALPTGLGASALTVAVFMEQGNTQVSWKTLLIFLVLFAINSVGAHASARAFRTRELGHWEPRDGDHLELVPPGLTKEESR